MIVYTSQLFAKQIKLKLRFYAIAHMIMMFFAYHTLRSSKDVIKVIFDGKLF